MQVGIQGKEAGGVGPAVQGYLFYKKKNPIGPYRRPMPRVLGGSWELGVSLWARCPCT